MESRKEANTCISSWPAAADECKGKSKSRNKSYSVLLGTMVVIPKTYPQAYHAQPNHIGLLSYAPCLHWTRGKSPTGPMLGMPSRSRGAAPGTADDRSAVLLSRTWDFSPKCATFEGPGSLSRVLPSSKGSCPTTTYLLRPAPL